MTIKKYFFLLVLLTGLQQLIAQENGILKGIVSDTSGYTVGFANITLEGTKFGTMADRFGQFETKVPAGKYSLVITCVGYQPQKTEIEIIANQVTTINFTLKESTQKLDEVTVAGRSEKSGTVQRIDAKAFNAVPNTTGNIENVVKQMAGVASNNELSSQYSVRGGSFDENLVYVNDIEIFRPVLIRSGQQEGLSFINPDLVSSIKFSSGGFDASYGDKISSVLDVTYKKPTAFGASASISMLGATSHFEGSAAANKLRYLAGFRYKTTKYFLGGLDTKGDYEPNFLDFQTNIGFDITPTLEFSVLGNISQNQYDFKPDTREIEFGTYNLPLRANIYYEGQEKDKYLNGMAAGTLNFHPSDDMYFKLIGSVYQNDESETFDLLGEYNISEIDNSSGQDSSLEIGVGGFLNHARNFLKINIYNVSHIGMVQLDKNKFKWGLTYQSESVNDRLNEWEIIDSAGYIYPYNIDNIKTLTSVNSKNDITSHRLMGYLQHTFEFESGNDKFFLSAGVRTQYWSFSKQQTWSPRISLSYQPGWKNGLMMYMAWGFYHQHAFFKEMRNEQGLLNKEIKAQQSVNYSAGLDYMFYSWARPFKFSAEVYYKQLDKLIPYRIDNVRSIYSALNIAKGYATGIDLRLNGELVKGTESWVSVSLLQTQEKILANSTIPSSNYYSRPTDQFVNINFYFQDYVPSYPSYRVHLNVHYGSELPVTIPWQKRWDKVQKLLPSYKRVDMGVSKMLKGEEVPAKYPWLNVFKEMWLTAEIFNIIGLNNTASFMWIKTFSNDPDIPSSFAVPNYLPGRRFNIKLTATF
ncbi:MAG TPA: carboxypeptidase-like regulatory domain-containing protein [Bacteroidales bacterium]|nr:carboxypeptidase-like regulatory domain-containing protein [Bacteroidales bacterium]